jgi:DNA-binding FadR family transcriptional regulator
VNLTRQLAETLGRAIVTGAQATGTFLSEQDIAGDEHASRVAVREAVRILEGKGLIDARPRRGTTVLPPDRWNIFDRDVQAWMRAGPAQVALLAELVAMRRIIEPAAAAIAAVQANPAHLAALTAAHDRMVAAQDGNGDSLDADVAFHAAILAATNNRFLSALTPAIETALRQSIRLTNALRGDMVGDIAAHTAVFHCIRDRDAPGAEAAMRSLLDDVATTLARGNAPPAP